MKEETGLADTLQRLKANLDACKRTRTEVQEAQRLEREIGGVFEGSKRAPPMGSPSNNFAAIGIWRHWPGV